MSIETLQTVVVIALSISTVLITIVGLQLIFLLRNVNRMVERLEKISSGLNVMTEMVEKSLSEFDSLGQGFKFITRLIGRFTKNHDDDNEE